MGINNFLNGPRLFKDNPKRIYHVKKNGTEFFGFDQGGQAVVIAAEDLLQVVNVQGAVSEQSIENLGPRITEVEGMVSDHEIRINNLDEVIIIVDDRLDEHDLLIASLASGSPKGTYPTLGDLEAAFPAGDTGIYVVTADGHWYYWNGDSWTNGGAYLVNQISDGVKTYSEAKSIKHVDGEPFYCISLSEV